jgi:hypothetical protein
MAHLFGTPVSLPHILAVFQQLQDLVDGGFLFFQLLHLETLATSSRLFGQVLFSLLHKLNVFQPQLFRNNVQVPGRVDISLNVDNFRIVETSYNLEDGIDGSDVRQKGIAQASTRG